MDPMQAYEQRRTSTRRPLEADATLVAFGDVEGRPRVVQVFDISMGGIGFHSERPAAVGSVCHIRLQTKSFIVDSDVQVSRCQERDSGYDIGARFIET